MARAQAPTRTRTRSVEVTDSLLIAAREILEAEGFDALTVRAVAARAGVAPMGVYSRFGGKQGLVEALFVAGFVDLRAAIVGAGGRDAVARLRRGCRAYFDFAVTHPHLYEVMFQRMLVLELSEEALCTAKETFDYLTLRVGDAIGVGAVAPRDEVEIAQEIWSCLHGASMLAIAGQVFTPDQGRTFDAMFDVVLRGLRPGAADAP
jgi:AcrR family transcriptional regulator